MTVYRPVLGRGLTPAPVFWVRGYQLGKFFENMGENLCSLVHSGAKTKHFKKKHSNVDQLPTSKLPLTTDLG